MHERSVTMLHTVYRKKRRLKFVLELEARFSFFGENLTNFPSSHSLKMSIPLRIYRFDGLTAFARHDGQRLSAL